MLHKTSNKSCQILFRALTFESAKKVSLTNLKNFGSIKHKDLNRSLLSKLIDANRLKKERDKNPIDECQSNVSEVRSKYTRTIKFYSNEYIGTI